MEYLVAADPVKARTTLGGQQIKNGSRKTPGPIVTLRQLCLRNMLSGPIGFHVIAAFVR